MSSPSSDQALSEQSLGWLDGLDSAFEQAAANGIAEHSYSIAGRPLLVRFAGRAMADRFMPALEHLQSKESADDAHVVQVWDAASTVTVALLLPTSELDVRTSIVAVPVGYVNRPAPVRVVEDSSTFTPDARPTW